MKRVDLIRKFVGVLPDALILACGTPQDWAIASNGFAAVQPEGGEINEADFVL